MSMSRPYFTTRNFIFTTVSIMIVFVASLSISTVASAQGNQGNGVPNGQGFQALQDQIDNIELTPGPQGDKGDKGEPGTSGLGDDNTVCSAETKGTIRYNTGANIFEGCDGTAWISLSSSAPSSFVGGTDQIQDADGNMYDTDQIGTQCWMAENLNVGTMVTVTTEMTNNTVIEKYCYNNDQNICATDGGLYQWDEMMQYSTTQGVQGICPTGWHVPTDSEWTTLEMALGMTQVQADLSSWRGTDQATQLELGGTSGFQALLAGFRQPGVAARPDAWFRFRGAGAMFWTSEEDELQAWFRRLLSSHEGVLRGKILKAYGYSVRCVKD